MAGLRFAVHLAFSSFGVLLLAASATSSASRPPAVYFVGNEWRAAPASNDDSTRQTLSKWAVRQGFYVGDVLDFTRSDDTVLLVRQGDYERCSAASPAHRFFADGGDNDSDTRFTLTRPGLFYFISGAPPRCEAGHRMLVRAVAARSTLGWGAPTLAPAPAPAPGVMAPSNRDRPMPVSLVQELLVPAVMGFLAACLFGGLIIWAGSCDT